MEVKYFKLMDCKTSLPDEGSTTVAFVPLLGFTGAIYHASGTWKSTITLRKIEPTHWLKPIDIHEEVSELNIKKR